MRKAFTPILALLLFSAHGCIPFALRVNPSLLIHMTSALFEECDPELAKQAIPGNLKVLEGLLKSDPQNRQILSSLAMGYGGYGYLFLEQEAPERASLLYLRSREYGVRALVGRGERLKNPEVGPEEVRRALEGAEHNDVEALFWLTFSWNAWINLHLDRPWAVAQMAASQACLSKILEIDETYFHGAPHILQGVLLAAKPALLGGDPKQARAHFRRALAISGGKFFLAQYFFAKSYAVAVQDKELFLSLLEDIRAGDSRAAEGACLINSVIQAHALKLAEQVNDLFY